MTFLRKHLSYANVMSTIAVFLLLGGGAAIAARKVPKGSVGPRQLRANAVRTPKIKANAVTTRKLHRNAVATIKVRDGAITNPKLAYGSVSGDKIADGSVTGTDLDPGSTPFSRVTDRLRGTGEAPFQDDSVYPLSAAGYTQPAGRTDQYVAAATLAFGAGCEPPRSALVELALDPADPDDLHPTDLAGVASITDETAGAATLRVPFLDHAGYKGMASLSAAATAQHTFLVHLESASCNSGSGIAVDDVGIDVIGTK